MPSLCVPLADLNLSHWIQSVPPHAVFSDPDYYIWCGSLVRSPEGDYCLCYSRWPRKYGHNAWVSHSEIAVAMAKSPFGPFQHHSVILKKRPHFWDGDCTHNPTVHCFDGKYYLYYMGNAGDGIVSKDLNWTHRNNQRIGVAWADHPLGPWWRASEPLIAPTEGFFDALCCSNPTITRKPDGGFLLIYKGVGRERPLPFGGPVVHVVAESTSPLGPFRKLPKPIFTRDGTDFAAEDPFVFYYGNRYWTIVKDMAGHFTNAGKSLALFESNNGMDWHLARHSLVATTEIRWADETSTSLFSLERPQLYFDESGNPKCLLCAADSDNKREHSFNVQIPLKEPDSVF